MNIETFKRLSICLFVCLFVCQLSVWLLHYVIRHKNSPIYRLHESVDEKIIYMYVLHMLKEMYVS